MSGLLGSVAGAALWTLTAGGVPPDPLRITPAEKAACTTDATRLCSDAYPDEMRLLTCMKAKRASLSPECAAALDAGMKRRGL